MENNKPKFRLEDIPEIKENAPALITKLIFYLYNVHEKYNLASGCGCDDDCFYYDGSCPSYGCGCENYCICQGYG